MIYVVLAVQILMFITLVVIVGDICNLNKAIEGDFKLWSEFLKKIRDELESATKANNNFADITEGCLSVTAEVNKSVDGLTQHVVSFTEDIERRISSQEEKIKDISARVDNITPKCEKENVSCDDSVYDSGTSTYVEDDEPEATFTPTEDVVNESDTTDGVEDEPEKESVPDVAEETVTEPSIETETKEENV